MSINKIIGLILVILSLIEAFNENYPKATFTLVVAIWNLQS